MAGRFARSRTSTAHAVLLGLLSGLAVVAGYLLAGLAVADWRPVAFVETLSVQVMGEFVGMVVLAVLIVGLPVVAARRFRLAAPLVVLVLAVTGWLAIGLVQGLLTTPTVFALALYAVYFAPVYLVLYGLLGGSEYLLRTGSVPRPAG